MSETAKHRGIFIPYCHGNGLDIGFGGDPIVDTAICLDLPISNRYSFVGHKPQHLSGSAENLYMFADNALDYVYSSHVIEDFENIPKVLEEWIRVIKPKGYLCLLFPDEQVYRKNTTLRNQHHKDEHLNIFTMVRYLHSLNVNIILFEELFKDNDYNCAIIAQKKGERA